ncbi:histone-lysine N-methyltransferase 2D-like isoform X2 [Engraulis encrasicolus]|uniref:histone-lysine N-methyltransferase 2D-like isoform X2 n=1 Tax=Engraulis encrasicolus TaxID=184585 RepID=UPI002FD0371F
MEDNFNSTKGQQWSMDEHDHLMSVLNRDHIKRDMFAPTRSKVKVFQEISQILSDEYGHSRTPTQTRNKYRRMMKQYNEAKEYHREKGRWYCAEWDWYEPEFFIPELESPEDLAGYEARNPPETWNPPDQPAGVAVRDALCAMMALDSEEESPARPVSSPRPQADFASTEESVSGMLPKNLPPTSPPPESAPVIASSQVLESPVGSVTTPRPQAVTDVVCVVGRESVSGMLSKDPPSTSPSSESPVIASSQVLESPVGAVTTPRPHTGFASTEQNVSGMLSKHPPSTSPSSESAPVISVQLLKSPVGAVTIPRPHAEIYVISEESVSRISAPVIVSKLSSQVLESPVGAVTTPLLPHAVVCVIGEEYASGKLSKNPPTSPSSESAPVIVSTPVLEAPVETVSTCSRAGKRKRSLFQEESTVLCEPQSSEEEQLETRREAHLESPMKTQLKDHRERPEAQLKDHRDRLETQFEDHRERPEAQHEDHRDRLETKLEDHHERLETQLRDHIYNLKNHLEARLEHLETQCERHFRQILEELREARQEEMTFRREQAAQTADFHKELLGVLDRMAQAREPQKYSSQ